MAQTPEEIMKQHDEMLEALSAELTRLNGNFDELMKKAGFTEADLKSLDPASLPAEVRAEFDRSVEEARREGARRATQAEAALATSTPHPAMGRKGAVRL